MWSGVTPWMLGTSSKGIGGYLSSPLLDTRIACISYSNWAMFLFLISMLIRVAPLGSMTLIN
jgi:hypothetical protein